MADEENSDGEPPRGGEGSGRPKRRRYTIYLRPRSEGSVNAGNPGPSSSSGVGGGQGRRFPYQTDRTSKESAGVTSSDSDSSSDDEKVQIEQKRKKSKMVQGTKKMETSNEDGRWSPQQPLSVAPER